MVASLLYYWKLCKSLMDIDFVINPYDPCLANKNIEGEQMTVKVGLISRVVEVCTVLQNLLLY
jgi:hypothetical protein